jgi:hypothetical protein
MVRRRGLERHPKDAGDAPRTAAPSLADLETALAEARRERDEALLALARERELTNALRLQLRAPAADVPRYPTGTGLGPPPLRYVVADRLNDSAKTALGPVHRVAKSLLGRRGKKA